MNWFNVFSNSLYSLEIITAALIFLSAYKRKKYYLFRLLLPLAFMTTGIFLTSSFPYNDKLLRFLQLLILNTLMFSGMLFCYKTSASNILFSCTAAIALQQITAGILSLIKIVASFTKFTDNMYVAAAFNETVTYAPVYALFYFLFKYNIKNKMKSNESNFKLKIMSAIIVIVCTGVYRFADGTTVNGIIARSLYSIICNSFALIIQFAFYEQISLRRDLSLEKELRRLEIKHYENWRDSVEIINIKYHDLKHQISSIQDSGTSGNWQEIQKALAVYDDMLKTGNEILDIILSEKKMLGDKFSIALTCMADGGALGFMQESDIYALFGNALDNAMNAVKEIGNTDKRSISLIVRRAGNTVIIHTENYFEGDITFIGGLPQTDKDKNFHGYGMKSIKMIVEKYNGTMDMSVSGDIFNLDISLQP